MQVSSLSSVQTQYAAYAAQATPSAKPPASGQPESDTVQLSAAARAHLATGDVDGDGDGH